MQKEIRNDSLASVPRPKMNNNTGRPGPLLTGEQKRKYSDFRKTKLIATSLFVLMLICYGVFKYFESTYAWLGFFCAFAEAAMVGALADWFAVTALFRYPLGIRLPHTAIIPNNKDRIGENIGDFVELNFFTAHTIEEKLRSKDLGKEIAEWISGNPFIVDEVCLIIPHMLKAIDDRVIRNFIRENVLSGIRSVELAPLLGNVLAILTADGKLQDLFDQALKIIKKLFEKSKPLIREKISERSPWYIKIFGMDYTIYDNVISSIEDEIASLNNPHHKLRMILSEKNKELIANLKTSPEYREKVEDMRDHILNNQDFIDYLDNAWNGIEPMLHHDIMSENSNIKKRLREALQFLCRGLLQEESVRDRINTLMHDVLLGVVRRHPRAISIFITREVRKWDTNTLIQQTEIAIGNDLQFIRINGTVIGGLVGLLIHAVSRLFF